MSEAATCSGGHQGPGTISTTKESGLPAEELEAYTCVQPQHGQPSKCDASIFGHVSDNVEALLLCGLALTSTALQRKAKCVQNGGMIRPDPFFFSKFLVWCSLVKELI